MGRLEGKSVIITGAGSGIGRAASVLFSREGAKLIIVDRSDGVTAYIGSSAPLNPIDCSHTQSKVFPRSCEIRRPNVTRRRTRSGSCSETRIWFASGKRPFAWANDEASITPRNAVAAREAHFTLGSLQRNVLSGRAGPSILHQA